MAISLQLCVLVVCFALLWQLQIRSWNEAVSKSARIRSQARNLEKGNVSSCEGEERDSSPL